MGMTYSLNGTESSKLSLQVALVSLVAESCDDEGLESIAPDVWVLVWLVYGYIVSMSSSSKTKQRNMDRGKTHSAAGPQSTASPAVPSPRPVCDRASEASSR